MTSTAGMIAVLAGGAGIGLLLWRRGQTAAPASECRDACKGMTGYALAACEAACLVFDNLDAIGGEVQDLAGGAEGDGARWSAESDRRVANNGKINGAPAAPLLTSNLEGLADERKHEPFSNLPTTQGPYRYANGCEPYAYAPGWSKCGAGTLDMYRMAIAQDASQDSWRDFGTDHPYDEAHARTTQVFQSPAALQAAIAANNQTHDEGSSWYELQLGAADDTTPREPLVKDNYGTGASGDPLTRGPFVDDGGTIWWLVRGRRFSAPAGKVPRAIAIRARGPKSNSETQATVDASIRALTDAKAVELVDVGSLDAAGTHTTYDCSNMVGSGLTWEPATSSWRRMRAGEIQNLGPCSSSGKAGLGDLLGSTHL